MQEGIVEAIITVLILIFLTVVGVPMIKNNSELVTETLDYTDDLSSITKESLLDLDRNTIKGGDVISFIRFYKDNSSVEVIVNIGADSHTYINENYDKDVFEINYEDSFTNIVEYENGQVKRITCTKN